MLKNQYLGRMLYIIKDILKLRAIILRKEEVCIISDPPYLIF